MSDIIQHQGTVESIDGSHIRVRIVQTSACATCVAHKYCNSSESKEKMIDVYTRDAATYQVGQSVNVFEDGLFAAAGNSASLMGDQTAERTAAGAAADGGNGIADGFKSRNALFVFRVGFPAEIQFIDPVKFFAGQWFLRRLHDQQPIADPLNQTASCVLIAGQFHHFYGIHQC